MLRSRCFQFLQRWVLVVLGLGFVAILSTPALAAPLVETSPSSPQMAVDDFLQHIPPGFYGVRDVAKIQAKVAEGKTLFIDVREPLEYLGGHIPGAINLPLRELAQHLDQVPHDQPVMLYCSTGYRTGIGVMALRLLGYDNVEGFPPSYVGWQQVQ